MNSVTFDHHLIMFVCIQGNPIKFKGQVISMAFLFIKLEDLGSGLYDSTILFVSWVHTACCEHGIENCQMVVNLVNHAIDMQSTLNIGLGTPLV